MVAAEAVPYIKVGGLADVVGSLPRFLESLGLKSTLVLPGYRAIEYGRHGIRPLEALPGLDVQVGSRTSRAEVYHTQLPGTGLDVFILGSVDYFFRDGVYDDPATGEGYLDNLQRYIFFSRAALELIAALNMSPDVIHCHDSQTALITGMLRTTLQGHPAFARTGSLFTIHNLAYQGQSPREALSYAGIDARYFHVGSPFEFWGGVNFMKVGIESADLVNTVSETYAREIQSGPEFGYGLEGSLQKRGNDLSGIVNGIDYAEWNPGTDPFLAARFSAGDLSGKALCRADLLERFGIPATGEDTPVMGMVSRLADQKGFDLIAQAADRIAAQNLRFVVLGQGQERYHHLLWSLAARYPEKIAVRVGFDNELAHRVYAGSDMLLMPSRYEPCGLNQLISLRYGTIPIVRATGGLVDTVSDYNAITREGTGFHFQHYSADEMMVAIERALAVYSVPAAWRDLTLRALAQNWSWEESARKYANLYKRIALRRGADAGEL
jgi:starch synthase